MVKHTEGGLLGRALLAFTIASASAFAVLTAILFLTMFILDKQFNPEAFNYWIVRALGISIVAGTLGLLVMKKNVWWLVISGAGAAIGLGFVYARFVT